MKRFLIILTCVILCLAFAGCSQNSEKTEIKKPDKIATGDEALPQSNPDSVEESPNVNGLRFTETLDEFTDKYNEISQSVGGADILSKEKWQKKGDETTDNNGTKIQYYYYDEDMYNFTATVEVESNKLMNIGCATTANYFVGEENGVKNSDDILRKSAVMAQAVCQFPDGSTDVLQDIFYVTTFENTKELWYKGFIFSRELSENGGDSTKDLMQLRVFPVTEKKSKDWNITDYEQYIAKS